MRSSSRCPRQLRFFLIVGLAVLPRMLGFAAMAQTAQPWEGAHFSGDPKAIYDAASAISVPSGTDVMVVEEQEHYSFDSEGRETHTHYLLYKILTQAGAEGWDSTGMLWEPWHDERPILRARVITKEYEVHALESKAITDSPARTENHETYGDQRVVRAPLPAIAPGVVVEEERTVRETAPFYAAGDVSRVYVGRVVPVHHMRITLEAPASLPLQYEMRLLPALKPQRTESDGRVKLVFDVGPLEKLDNAEGFLPSDVPAYASLTFSTGRSWQQIAEAYSAIVDRQIAQADVKTLAGKLIAGATSRDEKAAAILDYLNHEIRYTGVEFGQNSIVPHSPADALKQKYGDCKDKSSLLVAMLRAAGIPAYVALLDAGPGEDVSPTLPGMGMFDHAIVYVPGVPDDVWIDTTDEYTRLRQVPTADQGRLALVAREGATELTRTPISFSQDNLVREKREFYLAENGPARVVEITEPGGTFESQYRSYYADPDNEDRRKNLTGYVKTQYLAEKLDRIERSDPGDFAKPFQLTLETRKARRGFTELQDAVAAIRLETLFERLPEELLRREPEKEKSTDSGDKPKKERAADYQLPTAFVTEWQYSIVPPAGFRVKALPQNVKANAGPALLTEDFSADGNGVVHAVLRFDTVKSRFTVAEATEMRNQVAHWREAEATLIHFEPTAQALLREGKMREGFGAYRSLIALHPKEAVHHLQIADALLQAGLANAAREEARTAGKLEPRSALAQKTLAEILEYDLVGRKFRLGSDYAGAEAAFRAAQKLDPDDKAITGNLAILLEHDSEGRRYGEGAELKKAIAEYRSLTSEQLGNLGLKNNLAFALFYAKEFAEAEKEGNAQNPQLNSLIVASEAALHGAEAGLAEATRRSSGENQRKEILKPAGEMLMNVRDYAPAADLMEAGAAGDSASRTAGLAAALRKARHHEDITLPPDPAGIATRFFLLVTEGGMPKDKLLAISSRNARKVIGLEDADELKKTLEAGRLFRSSMARLGSSPDVALDVVLQLMEVKSEGNDASGYRVKVTVPGGKQLTLFTVKEDGEYKLLDGVESPNAIGLEILDRVNAGNLGGAKVLLDWLREEQHLAGGDDPLAGQAFPRLWAKGKDADAAAMKLAAAAILVQTDATAKEGVSVLEAAFEKTTNEPQKTSLALGLVSGYSRLHAYDRLLSVCLGLAQQYPESLRIFHAQSGALLGLKRFVEADQLAEERLKRLPGDVDALRVLVRTATARQDYKLAYERAKTVLTSDKSEGEDKNRLAWIALFTGSVSDDDVQTTLAASQAEPNNGNVLHTLGCIYAEIGKTQQAREVLVHAMDLGNLDEPNDAFWYAFGRIAEQYSEREVALADYARVSKPKREEEIPTSSYWLAQNRMKLMSEQGHDSKAAGK